MKNFLLFAVFTTARVLYAQTAVDSKEEIPIGEIKQVVTIQTRDTSLPLLLFLHGGPGGSVMGYSDKFTHRLQEHFIVVQWDQRETGQTLALNESPVPLTLDVFQRDTETIIAYLLKRYNREKLYLVAHSWGTVLGFHIARTHPELLYAYIPIGPMINQLESERLALSAMRKDAMARRNEKAIEELNKVNIPFGNGEQLYYHRKWLQVFSGSRRTLSKSYVDNWSATWLAVFNEASKDNLMETLPSIACPVYFFAGRKDYQTNSSIAEKYHLALKAPRKGFFWFETGHSIPGAAPEQMQDIIIEKILPETFIFQKPGALISTQ